MERGSSLGGGGGGGSDTSSVQACQRCKTMKIWIAQIYTPLTSNMEEDSEAPRNFADELPNVSTTVTQQEFRKSASHCVCVPNGNSARSHVTLPFYAALHTNMHPTLSALFSIHWKPLRRFTQWQVIVIKNVSQSSSCSHKNQSSSSLCFPSWATVCISMRPAVGPEHWDKLMEESCQALRALATSVKTRRLGLCVVPWEVVRVCGGHGRRDRWEIKPLVMLTWWQQPWTWRKKQQ